MKTRRFALLAVLAPTLLIAQPSSVPDFEKAMRGLGFDLAGDWNKGGAGNGIPDGAELAMIAALLTPSVSKEVRSGAVNPAAVRAAFEQARASASADMARLLQAYPTAATVAAGYAMLGRKSLDAYSKMSSGFDAPLKGNYALALALDRFLDAEGDADGDGVSNLAEWGAHRTEGVAAYVRAVLDPSLRQGVSVQVATVAAPKVRTIGIVLYPGFEALDVFGPLEMWANTSEFKVVLISENAGAVRSAQRFDVLAEYSFANAPPLDILMVPGGLGTRTELKNDKLLDYIRKENQRTELTTSVCTGSALLAKAGVLKGRRATTNKAFFSLATEQDKDVQWLPTARWVEDGKFVTSSGVSAGTDMALGVVAKLLGKQRADRLAYDLEYEWNDDPTRDRFSRANGKPRP